MSSSGIGVDRYHQPVVGTEINCGNEKREIYQVLFKLSSMRDPRFEASGASGINHTSINPSRSFPQWHAFLASSPCCPPLFPRFQAH